MSLRRTTHHPSETLQLGEAIGRHLAAGAVVGLDGDLGAGKTWMAKGLVRGIGRFDDTQVKSPAYNLVHEYPVQQEAAIQPVVHIDFYRLEDLSEMDLLLFSEYFDDPRAIILVEWASKFLRELVPGYLAIALRHPAGGGEQDREVEITTAGSGYGDLLDRLVKDWQHDANAPA